MSQPSANQGNSNPGGGAAAAEQNQPGFFSNISRMILMYVLVQWVMKTMFSNQNAAQTQDLQVTSSGSLSSAAPVSAKMRFINAWHDHETFDLDVYISANDTVRTDVLKQGSDPKTVLAFTQKGLTYDWAESNYREAFNATLETLSTELFEHAKQNGTVWAHAFFTRTSNRTPSNTIQVYGKGATHMIVDPNQVYTQRQITVYKPPPPVRKYKNLMSQEDTRTEDEKKAEEKALEEEARLEAMGRPYVSYWRPDVSLRYVHDLSRYDGGIPEPISKDYIVINTQQYLPRCYFDEFWQLKSSWSLLNSTVTSVPITFSVFPTSILRWKLADSIADQLEMQSTLGMGPSDNELQEFKRMFMETDPWLLGLVAVVSTLHMLFDFLAFQSDISFWKNTNNRRGLSFSSVFFGAVSNFIIFLYLLDNETSWMVLLSSGVGVLIEAWKLTKATDRVKIQPAYPFIVIMDVDQEEQKRIIELEKKPDNELTIEELTDKYDKVAFRYMSYLLIPLVGGYSIYSLYYETHKSWYSWIVTSLVGVIYMFGFITMLPQLYLNYKLKSVAHLPWKMLTFKALNTFIDDIFAFIIKMPTLHRLACLRDDVVFLIFLYQKWVYRTDYTRVNEFGIMFNADGTPVTVDQKEGDKSNPPQRSDASVEGEKAIQSKTESVKQEAAKAMKHSSSSTSKSKGDEIQSGPRSRRQASQKQTAMLEDSETAENNPDEVD